MRAGRSRGDRVEGVVGVTVRVSPRNVTSYTHKVSPTLLLPRGKLYCGKISRHAKMDREKPVRPQPYTHNYR